MPIRNSRAMPNGAVMALKNGAWMDSLVPRMASATRGKTVPRNTVKAIPIRNRLLSRKALSRLSRVSAVWRDSSSRMRLKSRKNEITMAKVRKTRKAGPTSDWAKACTELSTPERTMKVPRMDRPKVTMISTMFQTFIMLRFSCRITEWRKAVPVSQGIREAFSTGSQPQYPPQPSSS